jgi:hypothetical protein
MAEDIGQLAAGGGVAGAIVAVLLMIYRILFAKRSRCHGEMNGFVIDLRRANGGDTPTLSAAPVPPSQPPSATVVAVENPIAARTRAALALTRSTTDGDHLSDDACPAPSRPPACAAR